MISIFLGAGFSKWAADLPVTEQLFDFDISIFGKREEKKLKEIIKLKRIWDLDYPEYKQEEFIRAIFKDTDSNKKLLKWYIARRFTEPFIKNTMSGSKKLRKFPCISEYSALGDSSIIKAKQFLSKFCNPFLSGVITSNYDMLIEYSLGKNVFNYGLENRHLIRNSILGSKLKRYLVLSGSIPIAKLHGSISWDEENLFTTPKCGILGNSLIVAPTLNARSHKNLTSFWKLAEEILEKSKSMIIFGFAFNDYDHNILELLSKYGSNLKNVLLIDIRPKYERAKLFFPNADIQSCLPPPQSNYFIKSWVKDSIITVV